MLADDAAARDIDACFGRMAQEVLRRAHVTPPARLAELISGEAAALGLASVVLLLNDYEQRCLVPVPGAGAEDREPIPVVGTLAGRAFTSTALVVVDGGDGHGRRVWLPLLDGTDRLGVLEMEVAGESDGALSVPFVAALERLAHLVAVLLLAKNLYTDYYERLRRRRDMTAASELLWALSPPQVLATEDFVLAAILEPCYDNGGDAYDYSLADSTLHVAVLDGMGHGLDAAGATAFALSLLRSCRRRDVPLGDTYVAVDAALAAQYDRRRFVTALLAEIDVSTGVMRWTSAGHPPPLLVRDGHLVKRLEAHPATPMGLELEPFAPVEREEALEPGDMVLFYTDGLTEARRPDGGLFTVERLGEFIEREAGAGEAAPETLRRLREAIIGAGEGTLRDDATAVLVEWRRGSERTLMPETVLEA